MSIETLAPGISRAHGRRMAFGFQGHRDTVITVIEDVHSLNGAFDVAIPAVNHAEHQDGRRERTSVYGNDGMWSKYWSVSSAAEADKMLDAGWDAGLARVHGLTCKLTDALPPAQDVRRKSQWTTDGELNVDRWLGGYEDCWRGAKRKATPRFLTVSLAVSWGGNCNLTLEEMTWAGVAACAATLMLEQAGYSVGLSALSHLTHQSFGHDVQVLHVKKPGESLSDSHLAAALAHSVSFRLHSLRLSTTLPHVISSGIGHAERLTDNVVDLLKAEGILEADTYVLPTCRNEADAVAALTTLFTKLQQPTLA